MVATSMNNNARDERAQELTSMTSSQRLVPAARQQARAQVAHRGTLTRNRATSQGSWLAYGGNRSVANRADVGLLHAWCAVSPARREILVLNEGSQNVH